MKLVPFPSPENPFVSCDVEASWRRGLLACGFRLSGEWRGIRGFQDCLRSTPHGARADELWKTTCLEWFLHPSSRESYWEANVSPSGSWNLYRLDGYRKGLRPDHRAAAPMIRANLEGADLVIVFSFDLTFLLKDLAAEPEWRFAPALILETERGSKSYFSLAHTQPQPDFHHPEHRLARLVPEDRP